MPYNYVLNGDDKIENKLFLPNFSSHDTIRWHFHLETRASRGS